MNKNVKEAFNKCLSLSVDYKGEVYVTPHLNISVDDYNLIKQALDKLDKIRDVVDREYDDSVVNVYYLYESDIKEIKQILGDEVK